MKKYSTKEEFIIKANKKHSFKYDYSLVEYKDSKTKVTIICSAHGKFEQNPNNHVCGKGCKKCAQEKNSNKQRKTLQNFIKEANIKNNFAFDYSLSNYINTHSNLLILCKKHNVQFWQNAKSHIKLGGSCPICKSEKMRSIRIDIHSGWGWKDWELSATKSKNFDSFKIYIIECWSETERFFKIGRTFRKIKNRFYKTKLPYNFKIISEIVGNCEEIWNKEIELKSLNKENKYLPIKDFHGKYECYLKINEINGDNI